jgi:hypothetical protein
MTAWRWFQIFPASPLPSSGPPVEDISDADHATGVVRSLTKTLSLEDWRDWVLHVSDELGDELFIVPFALVLGKPN